MQGHVSIDVAVTRRPVVHGPFGTIPDAYRLAKPADASLMEGPWGYANLTTMVVLLMGCVSTLVDLKI